MFQWCPLCIGGVQVGRNSRKASLQSKTFQIMYSPAKDDCQSGMSSEPCMTGDSSGGNSVPHQHTDLGGRQAHPTARVGGRLAPSHTHAAVHMQARQQSDRRHKCAHLAAQLCRRCTEAIDTQHHTGRVSGRLTRMHTCSGRRGGGSMQATCRGVARRCSCFVACAHTCDYLPGEPPRKRTSSVHHSLIPTPPPRMHLQTVR